MSEPTYLWNWNRTRRHIAMPGGADGKQQTMCHQFHNDRAWHVHQIELYAKFDSFATKRSWHKIAKLNTVPVCKHCERAWAKTEPAS